MDLPLTEDETGRRRQKEIMFTPTVPDGRLAELPGEPVQR